MGDPVRVVGSYTAAPLPPGSPAPPSHPTAPALTTPTLARMANGNSGASPGTAAFVAEQRLLLQQQQRQGMREQEGVEVYAPALRPSREEAKGDDERMEEEGEEGEERGPVGLVEIIEKSQEVRVYDGLQWSVLPV